MSAHCWARSIQAHILRYRRGIEKDRQNLMAEKEKKQTLLRNHETKCHALQIEEHTTLNKLTELRATAERLEQMKKDVVSFQAQIKVCFGILR